MSSSTFETALTARRRVPVLPLAVALYVLAAWMAFPHIFLAMLQLNLQQLLVLPALLGVGVPAAALVLRPQAPLSMMRDLAVGGSLRLAVVASFFCIGLAAFTTFKLAIPYVVPFNVDPLLADVDALLHFGNPGELAHALVPGWAQYGLGWLYGPLWFMLWFGMMAFVALHNDGALRRQYFWSMALAVSLLGTVLATIFSSVGPILYDQVYHSDRFARLTGIIAASPVGDYMRSASGYLYDNYLAGGTGFATGISAMPSMHLAVVTLNALMLGRIGRVAGIVAWTYVALIMLGSVFMGWHYAIDGYVSIAAVWLIWWAVGRLHRRNSAVAD